MEDIKARVKAYIIDQFLPGENPDELTDATELISTGIITSLATVELVTFLEHEYDIELEAHDADPSKIGTLANIAKMVSDKLQVNE